MNFLNHLHNEARDYNVSIYFYDHQIDSIIGPTIKTFDVEDKIKMPKSSKRIENKPRNGVLMHNKIFKVFSKNKVLLWDNEIEASYQSYNTLHLFM